MEPLLQHPNVAALFDLPSWLRLKNLNKENAKNIYSTCITKTLVSKNQPAISREVINDPVYTLSTASPCSNCNLGTAFPDAIINSDRGVAPNLPPKEEIAGKRGQENNNSLRNRIMPRPVYCMKLIQLNWVRMQFLISFKCLHLLTFTSKLWKKTHKPTHWPKAPLCYLV